MNNIRTNIGSEETYNAPLAEAIEAITPEVLCASTSARTEDFEIEDFEF